MESVIVKIYEKSFEFLDKEIGGMLFLKEIKFDKVF